jgi:drug/metabolite transporter (DMT)-like permease
LIADQLHSRRGAYAALEVLTLIWGSNWLVLKFALQHAHPVVLTVQRTWLAVLVLFAVLLLQRRPLLPESWVAIAVTGFLQTTINFGSTTMALAGGGVGRTAVLVFTMPFWTLLLARRVLHERVKGSQWFAVGFAFAGLALVVEPWNWQGDIGPKLWAVLSGFGWAAGSVATKYFQRERQFDAFLCLLDRNLVSGVCCSPLLPIAFPFERLWERDYGLSGSMWPVISTASDLLWIAVCASCQPARPRSTCLPSRSSRC